MSSNLAATACLITSLQLDFHFCCAGRGAGCMSHNGHATPCLLNWSQLEGPLFCRRGLRRERWDPVACPRRAIACLITCLQFDFHFCCAGRGASCICHNGNAAPCLLTWYQLGGLCFVGGDDVERDGAQLHVPH